MGIKALDKAGDTVYPFHEITSYRRRTMHQDRKAEIHTIEPFFDSSSKLLILGSFPSVKSREAGFYYAHPTNRFWKVLSSLFNTELGSIDSKKEFLSRSHIALWDTIGSCTIEGSSDSSIEDVIPNDIDWILSRTEISTIILNGSKSRDVFLKHFIGFDRAEIITLPSTSAANASYSLERLISCWHVLTELL